MSSRFQTDIAIFFSSSDGVESRAKPIEKRVKMNMAYLQVLKEIGQEQREIWKREWDRNLGR